MIDIDKIRALTEEFVADTDMYIVDVVCSSSNVVEVTLDSDTSVSIDKCVELSRTLNSAFDRDVEDFELIVGSSGIGQPFRHPKQYSKAIGKEVEVLLKNGIKYKGTLIDAGGEEIEIEYKEKQVVEGKKKKQLVTVKKNIKTGDIKSTILLLKF
ncbi:MAG: ribosome assembly cofactor RimP [Rikenellaceae bacterium]|nr:ribosome assembly cofactor RimP [Rikenellaceae bacterium]